MDRQFAYSGAIPLDTDLLSTNKDAYIGLAKLSEAILGTGNLLNGFTCVPTAPASLQVSVSAGELYSLQTLDSTVYGALGTDSHLVYKQGISLDPTLLTITPPGTAGFSQNYLIQFAFEQVDGDSTVLAYYNPTDPTNPYSGPNNSGAADDTVRENNIIISAKAGVAASTGTQTTPSPDSGYIGGFVVTVANGQTTITSGNILVYSSANFITETLIQKLSQTSADIRYAQKTQIQAGTLIYGVDSGSANAIVATISPAIAAYTAGMTYYVKINAANTGVTTANLNSIGVATVKLHDGRSLYANALVVGMIAQLFYDGTNFQLLNACDVNPAITSLTSGSGNYITPTGAKYLYVEMAGGGGGGGASGDSGKTDGADGSDTTFGGSLTAGKGLKGTIGNVGGGLVIGSTGGAGGSASGGDINLAGGYASGGGSVGVALGTVGGAGGNSAKGGGGGCGTGAITARAGATNTGGGGGGAGGDGTRVSAGGGGGGGYLEKMISSPSATYAYSVGAGGAGGTAGPNGGNGGAGGSGYIMVTAYF